MAEKRYSLTKPESDRIGNLLSVARIQEELLNSVTLTYKSYLLDMVFPRLKIEPEKFALSKIDLNNGELIIGEPEKPPVQPKKNEISK